MPLCCSGRLCCASLPSAQQQSAAVCSHSLLLLCGTTTQQQQRLPSADCRVHSSNSNSSLEPWTLDSADVSRQDQSWLLPNWSKGLQYDVVLIIMVIQHHFLNRKALRNARQECSIKRGMHSSRVPRLNDTVQCHSCGSVPAGRNQEWFAGAALEPAAAAEQQPARLQTAAEQDYCTNSESSSEPISRAALEQLLLVQSSGAYTGYII